MSRHDNTGTVSLVVLGHQVVDFEWNNACCRDRLPEWAHGFLRGSTVLLRISDEDNKIDVACGVHEDRANSCFHITEAHGLHTGITSSEDRAVDSHMLQEDADLRGRANQAGRRSHTHFECVQVVSEMLRTYRPGWTVIFSESGPGADARPLLNSVLASHITLLMEGVTHVEQPWGKRRMVYM